MQMASPALRCFEGLRAVQGVKVDSQLTSCSQLEAAKPARVQIVAQKKVAKKKQIVLTKSVPELGKSGDLVTVKVGFFRNYLFPQGYAKTATAEILRAVKEEQERLEAEKRKVLEDAQKTAKQFQTIGGFTVRRKQGTGKSFFGSVSKQDLVEIIKANTNRDVSKDDIELPEIKEIGQYTVTIKLHPEVIAEVRLQVIGK